MPVYPRQNSNLQTVLEQVKGALVAANIVNNVWVTVDPMNFQQNIPDDRFIFLTPGRQVLDQGSTAGGGIDYNFVQGELTITIWNRLMLDQAMQDELYLTDASLGLLPLLMEVVAALQVTDVTDPSSGQYITAEPMRFISIEPAQKSRIPGWAYIQGKWELRWTLTLPGQI